MSARVRYSENFPCPVCGGHSRLPRHQGRRCSGYLLKPTDWTPLPVAYCSRISSNVTSPSGDLWAHPQWQSRSKPAIVTNRPVGEAKPRTSKRWTIHHQRHAIAFHAYGGAHPFEVVRFDEAWRERGFPKSMPRHGTERGWFTGIPPAMRSMTDAPLYRQDDVIRALEAGDAIDIVEGEADADAIWSLGHVATTNPCGALKWKPHHTAAIASVESHSPIRIVRDRDREGTEHASRVYSALWSAGISRARLSILEAAQGKDARDHLAAGFTLDEFVAVPIRVRSGEAAA